MKAQLENAGIPYKQIDVYGSQIVITSWCEASAIRWSKLLRRFARVRKDALKCLDDAKENKGTCLNPSVVKVWRTYAVIESEAPNASNDSNRTAPRVSPDPEDRKPSGERAG
jgi:hypothetical protein